MVECDDGGIVVAMKPGTRRCIMLRQCCVCKKIHVDGKWVQPTPEQIDHDNITHGYCEECYKDFMRTVAEYTSAVREKTALTAVA